MDDKVLLKVKNLKISFRNNMKYVQVVRGIDLEVNKGEIVGILGESGSGKTVSSNSIIGLIDNEEGRIDSGEIYFNNMDLLRMDEKELRKIRGRNISYIFQDPSASLNPYRKAGKQIEETLRTHGLKCSKEIVLKVMKDVGIDDAETVYDMYPFQLSGGLCQRVMISIGLICNPELIIADEPTTSIDASLRKKILQLLKEINEKYGTSIILITHDFDEAKYLCHRIVIMYGGLVMEEGRMDDVLRNPMHPYTEELLKCVNSLDKGEGSLYTLDGSPPNPLEFKNNCPFYPRCKKRMELCNESIPKLVERQNRRVRCFRTAAID